MEIFVRQENKRDFSKIHELVTQAFLTAQHSDGKEQELVCLLRKSEAYIPELSLVVEIDGEIAGHIMFTKAKVGKNEVLVLAPLSVKPKFQKQGVGTALILEGHRRAKEIGYEYVVVLGSETYYPQFGYIPAKELGVIAPKGIKSSNYMAIQLQKDAMPLFGKVEYSKEFGLC